MKFYSILVLLILFITRIYAQVCDVMKSPNNCVSFAVGQGTGCQWMCEYCANTLGTNNYYFTTPVCSYQSGGCVGNPQSGVAYTCCSA